MRIGIYFPENPSHSVRADKSQYAAWLQPFDGLRQVASQIRGHDVIPVTTPNDVDVLLVSLMSMYDIADLHGIQDAKCKIIVGGPACCNVRLFPKNVIAACFGRCDNGQINQILDGQELPNVWYRHRDPDLSGEYQVGRAVNSTREVGCVANCSFCFYGAWNHHVVPEQRQISLFSNDSGSIGYRSGVGFREDFFNHFDWKSSIAGGVTALDGCSESTRVRVRKPILMSDITRKLLQVNSSDYHGNHRVKIYVIYGFPWEEKPSEPDLIPICRAIDDQLNRKVTIKLMCSHFCPFAKTELWAEKFNWTPFHLASSEWTFVGRNIRVFAGTHNQSPRLAAINTLLQRYDGSFSVDTLFSRKIWQSDWESLRDYCANNVDLIRMLSRQDTDPCLYVQTPKRPD